MLKNTFIHLPAVGPKTERRLWSDGVLSWDDVLRDRVPRTRSLDRLAAELARSEEEYARGNGEYFAERLPGPEMWRLYADFRHSAAYVDIETTGGMVADDHITTVRTYEYGVNLADFARDIGEYKLLVTFNGKCFDAPIIERSFGMSLPRAHLDLRFLFRSLGLQGGLKRIEKAYGLDRREAEGLDGFFAVLLWRDYVDNGNPKALETLLAYNVYDVLGLETLAVHAFNESLARTPFAGEHALPLPVEPPNPYVADPATVERIRRRYGLFGDGGGERAHGGFWPSRRC
jgi:uncharacterized protein YprB with RNaseH-like and TPR domain